LTEKFSIFQGVATLAKSKSTSSEFRFSIIAGTLKGKKITAPDLGVTRPPLSRIRKSIFDSLSPYLQGAQYLDLFSGTGSYLFEATSRGAASALGIELEEPLADSINRQAENLGVADRLNCECCDVFAAIPKLAKQRQLFDIIMIAPPQYGTLIDQTLACLSSHRIVHTDGLILCQHDTSETDKIDFGSFTIDQRRKYGNTTFTVVGVLEP